MRRPPHPSSSFQFLCNYPVTNTVRVVVSSIVHRSSTSDNGTLFVAILNSPGIVEQLKRQFLEEDISAVEYEAARMRLLTEQQAPPQAAGGVDLDTMLTLLADIPALMRQATRME